MPLWCLLSDRLRKSYKNYSCSLVIFVRKSKRDAGWWTNGLQQNAYVLIDSWKHPALQHHDTQTAFQRSSTSVDCVAIGGICTLLEASPTIDRPLISRFTSASEQPHLGQYGMRLTPHLDVARYCEVYELSPTCLQSSFPLHLLSHSTLLRCLERVRQVVSPKN